MTDRSPSKSASTRRDFLKTSSATVAGAAATASLVVPATAHAAGSDTIKVGLIGCGGRGTGAAEQSAGSGSNVKIYAMADMFSDRLDAAKGHLQSLGDKFDVSSDRCFTGFDAYKKLLATDVDLVILATPPGFRPMHLTAAIAAGKHVFTEKPVAVDPTGVRQVLAAAEEAKAKNLGVVAGTQRRHQACYLEAMKRIHGGEIGEITGGRCYWNQGSLWVKNRESGWSDMEWQLRNWLYFTWLSGDHICEQHIHNLDVINWALQAHPIKAVGMGGRQVRTGSNYGNIFDHFAIDLEYPGGVHVMSMCRQIDGCAADVSEAVVGSKGVWSGSGDRSSHRITGATKWRFRGSEVDPYRQEHIDLINSIRDGKPLNELKTVAESTLTAIMSRMSAYTGKEVTWEQAMNSKLDIMPKTLEFGPLAVAPVAVPGQTELI
jgi:predicted dehydrogenase